MAAGFVGHLDTNTTLTIYWASLHDRAEETIAGLKLFEGAR